MDYKRTFRRVAIAAAMGTGIALFAQAEKETVLGMAIAGAFGGATVAGRYERDIEKLEVKDISQNNSPEI